MSSKPGFSFFVKQIFKEAQNSTSQKKHSAENIECLGCRVFSESGAIGLESKNWIGITEKSFPARKWISGIKLNFSHRTTTNKPGPGEKEQAVFIDIIDFSLIEETQRQEMDFIALDLESEFIFRQFFAGLSDLTIKKWGRGCLPSDEAKQEKNKEGEP